MVFKKLLKRRGSVDKAKRLLSKPKGLLELPYKLWQPLTPPLQSTPGTAVVSDLFLWRTDGCWDIYFYFSDLRHILDPVGSTEVGRGSFCFFDCEGSCIGVIDLDYYESLGDLVSISDMLSKLSVSSGTYGTFAVFHHLDRQRDEALLGILGDARLAERGYLALREGKTSLLKYVHGNYDAVLRGAGGKIKLLSGRGWFKRNYRCQHMVTAEKEFEYFLVNPSTKPLRVEIYVSILMREMVEYDNLYLKPGGCFLARFSNNYQQPVNLIFRSNLVMLRPIVFEKVGDEWDVFHG